MAVSGFKGVSRIDQPHKRNHGWFVRVVFQKKLFQKFFSDGVHGGRDRALHQAVQYRDDLERDLGKPRTDRVVVGLTTKNSTGVIGVQKTLKSMRQRNGELVKTPVYEVTWSPEPLRVRRTSFSIRKHGDEGAFQKAFALRKRIEREVYGAELPSQPPVSH